MRKKIEVTSDHWHEAVTPPAPGNDTHAHGGSHKQTKAADPIEQDLSQQSPPPPEAATPPEPDPPVEPTALQAELDSARQQVEDLKKQVLYANAEFQNFRRRKDEESRDLARFANSELILKLLPILDNFDRALQAAEQTRNFDALITGISGMSKQLQAFLQKAGVTPIEALGKDFDPNFHEAIGHAETSEFKAGAVAEEVQRGYLMHDRVLRPALVKVSQG